MFAPGDAFWTAGQGLAGWIIRHGSGSSTGHVGLIVEVLEARSDGSFLLLTHEAFGSLDRSVSGLRERTRDTREEGFVRCARVLRTEGEVLAALARSHELLGSRYAWGEIARLAVRFATGRTWRRGVDPAGVICSNHVTQCLTAGRPALEPLLRYPSCEVWPGRLADAVSALEWLEATGP